MEKEYFNWKKWDDLGDGMICFYDVTLNKDIDTFKEGFTIVDPPENVKRRELIEGEDITVG